MPTMRDPAAMSPEERAEELAALFAEGLNRIGEELRQQDALPADDEVSHRAVQEEADPRPIELQAGQAPADDLESPSITPGGNHEPGH